MIRSYKAAKKPGTSTERGMTMIRGKDFERIRNESLQFLRDAGIALTSQEAETMEMTDFGLRLPRDSGSLRGMSYPFLVH